MHRSWIRAFLTVALLISLALPVAAQGTLPPSTPSVDRHPLQGASPKNAELGQPSPVATSPAAAPQASEVTVGQPGLSFRYAQTYGTAGSAYYSDTLHLNWPYGIATAGNSVWIAEQYGHRAIKYSSSGTPEGQIGLPGINDYGSQSLRHLMDVAVDDAGNVWLADSDAGQVSEYDASLNFVKALGQQWQHGQGNDMFDQPVSVAFDTAGRVYVSDGAPDWDNSTGNHRIQIFDSAGAYLGTLGVTATAGSDNSHFHGPRHIAIDGSQMYVADSGNQRVQVFNVSSYPPAYVATIGVTGQSAGDNTHFDNPSGVAVDANYVYVADTGNQRVQIFGRSTRAFVASIGTGQYGNSNDRFAAPSDVAVDASGNIYVADYANQRVQKFSSAHTYAATYGTTGVPYVTDGNHFFEPRGLAANPDGSIYVVEEHGERLIKLDASGNKLWAVGQPGIPGGWDSGDNSHLNQPYSVAADSAGRAYVADQWNHRIQIFNPDGSYAGTVGTPPQDGQDNVHFNAPHGVFVASNNYLYVADTNNHRVQIFDAAHSYVATLGVTGQSGADNAHFNAPQGVAVDGNGFIYVADTGNERVQVFGANRSYLRTIGETGVTGNDFGHFQTPSQLAIDAANNLYVADAWNSRVQVFDHNGAYLSTIGTYGYSGSHGQMHSVFGVAVDRSGAVYASSYWDNYTVQKSARGVPRWQQTNINGFGNQISGGIDALASFNGMLYAASYRQSATIWRRDTSGAWTLVVPAGFGDQTNVEIMSLAVFKGMLYAGTFNYVCDTQDCSAGHPGGAQIWRSADGTNWDRVTLPQSFGSWNLYISTFGVFNDTLYAGTAGADSTHGTELWRSTDGTNWEQAASNGFDNDPYNTTILSLAVYGGNLYAGTRHGDWYSDAHANGPQGGEVWRSGDGSTWQRVNDPGFGDVNLHRVETLSVFDNQLYALISRLGGSSGGAQIWRCAQVTCNAQTDWVKVADNGFGVPQNQYIYAGTVFKDRLYAAVANDGTGVQLWSTGNGTDWTKALVDDGFGVSSNSAISNGALIVHNDHLVAGVSNSSSGGEIWMFLDQSVYLPLTRR